MNYIIALRCQTNLSMSAVAVKALVHMQVVSHKHLRQRIEHWVATGGSLPAEASAILAEDSRVCASEASYQVLSQGPPRFDSGAMPDSPRADSVATSAGHASTVRRRVGPLQCMSPLQLWIPAPVNSVCNPAIM